MSFSIGNFIVLGLFFLSGFYFGKLTKKLSILKVLLALLIGSQIYLFLVNAHFLIIWAFLLGVLANHAKLIYRAYYWAYDLKDVLFALKHRTAFDDIRRREEELEDRIRQFRNEQKEFYKQSSTNEPNNTHSNRQERAQKSKPQSHDKSKPKPRHDDIRGKHLRTLGLDPMQNYNSEQIRKAYRAMAKKTHPDTGGSKATFIEVMKAYEWLQQSNESSL